MLVSSGSHRRHRARLFYGLLFLCLVSVGITMPACGGGGTSSATTGGTPAGTYDLTVTGQFTSGVTTLTHATQFSLVVQ